MASQLSVPVDVARESTRARLARYIKDREAEHLSVADLAELALVIESFPQYHGNNPYLIWREWKSRQRSITELSELRTFKGWTSVGRCVQKGESGIGIYAPLTGAGDGETLTIIGCAAVSLFDISQTQPLTDGAEMEPATTASARDPQNVDHAKLAAKLRTLAVGLEKDITRRMNPGTANQRPTHRRLRMVDASHRQGERLQRIQALLRALADAHDIGEIPPILAGIATRTAVEALHDNYPPRPTDSAAAQFIRIGIADPAQFAEARQALLQLAPHQPREIPLDQQIKRQIQGLAVARIPGWYPTPPIIAAALINAAEINPAQRVLEPSAGAGHIADLIRAAYPHAALDVIELAYDLRTILALKHYTCIADNFLSFAPTQSYDRIVMNPPFDDRQDAAHVQYAYELLKPAGGRLVALMSHGTLIGGDVRARRFQEWLAFVGGSVAATFEASAFQASDRPISIATDLVVIDR